MFIYDIEYDNRVNGPTYGSEGRTVIWFTGCSIYAKKECPGCWNGDINTAKGEEVTPKELVERILHKSDYITLSGGNPTDQAEELEEFMSCLNERRSRLTKPKARVFLFTGLTLEEMHQTHPNLLPHLSLLKTGRYGNEQVITSYTEEWTYNNQQVQIDIDKKGAVTITGYPPKKTQKLLEELLGKNLESNAYANNQK